MTNTVGNKIFGGTTANAATNTTNAVAANGKGFAVTDANLKLAAVEDLGGGLKASFDYTLETAAFRGAPATRADSGMAVSGGFGSVAMRNTRSSDLLASIASPAISLPDGLYDGLTILTRGNIDTVAYTSPKINGFTGSVTYAEGNDGAINVPTADTKTSNILGLNYANGPLSASVALKSNSLGAGSTVKKSQSEFAVSYDLGVAKVSYAYDDKTTTATTAKAANGFSVTVPVGAISFGAQMFSRGDLKQTEFGASYAFSKRTALNVATGKLAGSATAANNGTQSRVQLKHTF